MIGWFGGFLFECRYGSFLVCGIFFRWMANISPSVCLVMMVMVMVMEMEMEWAGRPRE